MTNTRTVLTIYAYMYLCIDTDLHTCTSSDTDIVNTKAAGFKHIDM